MSIARAVAGSLKPVTPQTLADMALEADQRRRQAIAKGDHATAAELDKEICRLAAMMEKTYDHR